MPTVRAYQRRSIAAAAAAAVGLIGCGGHGAARSRSAATPSATTRPATQPAAPVRRAAGSSLVVGVGNVPGCLAGSAAGLTVLRDYHASILRIVVDPRHGPDGQAVGCIRAAVAAGYRFNLVVDYDNQWPVAQDVAFFRHVLGAYGRYAWAVSIGNEQDLVQGTKSETGRRYAAVWRSVEPLVTQLAPKALRVAGEISPWGVHWLQHAWASGLPGAQAIAVHAYLSHYGFDLPSVRAWMRTTRLPLWVTEGLAGPNAWPAGYHHMYAVPRSAMRGVAVADAWLN